MESKVPTRRELSPLVPWPFRRCNTKYGLAHSVILENDGFFNCFNDVDWTYHKECPNKTSDGFTHILQAITFRWAKSIETRWALLILFNCYYLHTSTVKKIPTRCKATMFKLMKPQCNSTSGLIFGSNRLSTTNHLWTFILTWDKQSSSVEAKQILVAQLDWFSPLLFFKKFQLDRITAD